MKKISSLFRNSRFFFAQTYAKEEKIFSQEYFLDNYKKSLEKTGLFQLNLGIDNDK